jgi:hypothetical protein
MVMMIDGEKDGKNEIKTNKRKTKDECTGYKDTIRANR